MSSVFIDYFVRSRATINSFCHVLTSHANMSKPFSPCTSKQPDPLQYYIKMAVILLPPHIQRNTGSPIFCFGCSIFAIVGPLKRPAPLALKIQLGKSGKSEGRSFRIRGPHFSLRGGLKYTTQVEPKDIHSTPKTKCIVDESDSSTPGIAKHFSLTPQGKKKG